MDWIDEHCASALESAIDLWGLSRSEIPKLKSI